MIASWRRFCALVFCIALALPAQAQSDPTAAWQPSFDPSKAEHTYILSNISHPAIEGVGVGYRIRDKVWERSNGRLYVDFRPLAQLGGERDVISKLRMGAVHGMLSSSVAAANVADKLGIVNLPYVVDTFEKLDKFIQDEELFEEFRQSPRRQGVIAVDITSYGTYGWATTKPVRSLEDARGVNFRIAEAPVNIDIYRAWGNRFTVMPWPDVPQALQTGVIDGLDHTPTVSNITGKFDVAKYFTEVNYAQGLFIHLINERWLNRLPADLREILLDVIAEESAKSRELARIQHEEQIAAAKAKGVEFIPLSAADRQRLIELAEPVYKTWGERIGADYLQRVRDSLEK
ncbi:TRAP transporter substrate-binding protein [Desulfurispirillum indicum]|uniref:Extracellular solute-binding protein, family 7 n=1 Tax=Desulfurispirillum indicum (strain ATCC BAA-1389 / DSM 22839 / S5) TaxID=653733 RepID=E6W4R2_DESIS|nr:TRAP transporter substrate-binding protein [Desulfurispirillum indicum]ADU64790.1 Extracellular solute-binding protein, family 7 [Desulfurispirillum indicum S5]UCZ56722.1 TRAP transporter substrate-binding protein [Desulfurispirillum indicum]